MSPRPDVSEVRIQQILEAAMAVFARLGFHNARMDDIVTESGLSKGALYWYFKSKDDIIQAILDNIFERELAHLRSLQTASGPASQRLLEFTHRAVQDLKKMIRLMPITYEFYALAFRQKAVRQAIQGYFRSYLNILVPLIQQGVDQGEFRPVDAQAAAIAVGALLEGAILLWVIDPETIDFEAHILSGTQLLLAGLHAPPAGSASNP